jgi:hypothetical protein
MNRADDHSKPRNPPRFVDGDVLDHQLWDEQGKPCAKGLTRDQARELKRSCGGVIVKVVVTH